MDMHFLQARSASCLLSPSLILILSLLPLPAISVSFPLTSFPAYSTVAPCATGHLSYLFNTNWFVDCSSSLPLKSYGSCICAYQMTDVNYDLSVHFSADAECSTSGVSEVVTQLCGWCGVDLAKDGAGGTVATTALGAGAGARGSILQLDI